MTGGAMVSRSGSYEVEQHAWGRLVWMVAGRLGNSATLTVGRCYIEPGQANPRHYHPNCDEVLHGPPGPTCVTSLVRSRPGHDSKTCP